MILISKIPNQQEFLRNGEEFWLLLRFENEAGGPGETKTTKEIFRRCRSNDLFWIHFLVIYQVLCVAVRILI